MSQKSTDLGKRIAIADDEALIRMGLRRILEDAGHVVVGEASTGAEALQLVPKVSPDLIVLDIRMPEPNGIEVAHRLKVDCPVPVIFLTAYSDRQLVKDAADAGGYAYIVKPMNERAVLAAVELVTARWTELQAAKDALETRKLVERAKGSSCGRSGSGRKTPTACCTSGAATSASRCGTWRGISSWRIRSSGRARRLDNWRRAGAHCAAQPSTARVTS